MKLTDLQFHIMTGGKVRRPGWVEGLFLRWNHQKGWEASIGGTLWTTEIGMLLGFSELLANDWVEA